MAGAARAGRLTMRVLITGACGFVGSTLARAWSDGGRGDVLVGLDNFMRPGSETNRSDLRRRGVRIHHGDIRCAADFETLPDVDVVIEAAAHPSVLAGVDGRISSRQLVEHNLAGTVNMLEYCRARQATFILLSTSRVYSIPPLAALPVEVDGGALRPTAAATQTTGVSAAGIDETFSTAPPISLYGASKLASETLALEYGRAFEFPVWINRCGVLAGAGQFGRADQGIFAYWINAWRRDRPLRYIGFGGHGHQVRDCLHPADLLPLLLAQIDAGSAADRPRTVNVSGGPDSARSLRQLSDWCTERYGPRSVEAVEATRPFDVPWIVLDHGLARSTWNWTPSRDTGAILDEIADHAERHPDWLELSEQA